MRVSVLAASALATFSLYAVPRSLHKTSDAYLFFDGVCNLCDGFVNFVADHESSGKIRFGAIQRHGDLMESYGAGKYAEGGSEALSTLVLIQGGTVYVRSDAALRTIALLDSPYNLISVFHILPAAVRDTGYKLVAKYRYKIFGQTETCRPPSPKFERRFLEYVEEENAQASIF